MEIVKKITMDTILILGGCVLVLVGCAGKQRQSAEEKILHLEREVIRLKAESANLKSRNLSKSDRLLVLQKQVEQCQELDHRKKLKVVKITAGEPIAGARGDSADADIEVQSYDDMGLVGISQSPDVWNNKQKRPVLSLGGEATRVHRGVASRQLSRSRAADVPLTHQGENLGVVRKNQTVGSTQMDTGQTVAPGPMDDFNNAYLAYSNKNFGAAVAGFSKFLSENAKHGYADNAVFWLGESHFAQGKMIKAVGEFERLLRRYPHSEKGPSALYKIGYIYDKLNDRQKAAEYYFKVVERYPGTKAAKKASQRVTGLRQNNISQGIVNTSLNR